MKSFFLTIIFLFSLNSLAKTQMGTYEVPVEDEALKEFAFFDSAINYSGKSIAESDELIVTMPIELTGIENKFTLKKKTLEDGNYTWVSNSDLFTQLQCDGYVDLVCEMHFNPEAVEVIQDRELGALGAFMATSLSNFGSPGILQINRGLAAEAMFEKGLSQDLINKKLEIVDKFSSEPIGIMRYLAEKEEESELY